MTLQLTLNINLQDDATYANFHQGNNKNLISCLKKTTTNNGEQYLYLWGNRGVGRSHLLQACCHAASDLNKQAVYLPLNDISKLTPAVFDHLETMDLICIDDIEAALGDNRWEEALFNFYNRVRDSHAHLIISAGAPSQQLNCGLADLQSRLAWGLSFQVHGLNEEQLMIALQMRAANRGIQLSDEVANYLLRRYPRNMATLSNILMELDHASLIEKRRLTIPFIKKILGEAYASNR